MADALIRLAVLALRPFEIYHQWSWNRSHRRGRFRPPYDGAAVTTRRPE